MTPIATFAWRATRANTCLLIGWNRLQQIRQQAAALVESQKKE